MCCLDFIKHRFNVQQELLQSIEVVFFRHFFFETFAQGSNGTLKLLCQFSDLLVRVSLETSAEAW